MDSATTPETLQKLIMSAPIVLRKVALLQALSLSDAALKGCQAQGLAQSILDNHKEVPSGHLEVVWSAGTLEIMKDFRFALRAASLPGTWIRSTRISVSKGHRFRAEHARICLRCGVPRALLLKSALELLHSETGSDQNNLATALEMTAGVLCSITANDESGEEFSSALGQFAQITGRTNLNWICEIVAAAHFIFANCDDSARQRIGDWILGRFLTDADSLTENCRRLALLSVLTNDAAVFLKPLRQRELMAKSKSVIMRYCISSSYEALQRWTSSCMVSAATLGTVALPETNHMAEMFKTLENGGSLREPHSAKTCSYAVNEALSVCSEEVLAPAILQLLPTLFYWQQGAGGAGGNASAPKDDHSKQLETLRVTSSTLLKIARYAKFRGSFTKDLLRILESAVGSSSWHVRKSVLRFVGLAVVSGSLEGSALGIILQGLKDPVDEVQLAAMEALSCAARTMEPSDISDLCSKFIDRAGQRLPRKASASSPRSAEEKRERRAAIADIKAATHGLCGLIRRYPFTVQPWCPSALVALAKIASRKAGKRLGRSVAESTIAEFKRTHQDGWAQHTSKFKEEQLEMLREHFLPQNYYA